mgnify:CR=1 FL=1
MRLSFLLATSTLLLSQSMDVLAGQPDTRAHEHGVARLELFKQATELHIGFYATGTDILGFEHQPHNQAQADTVKKAIALLHKVGIRDHQAIFNSYPYQLPEGVCQKIMIAMAIAKKPKLLIADEPTTALESTTQAQLFRLLASFNQLKGMSILLISHELETVARNTQTLSVLYCGQLVEAGETAAILKQPFHPYTDALIKSVPEFQPELASKQPLYAMHGSIPTLQHLPIGCRLGPRCPNARKECVKTPVLERLQNHYFSCHFPLQGKKL